jgi:hypothetical protein
MAGLASIPQKKTHITRQKGVILHNMRQSATIGAIPAIKHSKTSTFVRITA